MKPMPRLLRAVAPTLSHSPPTPGRRVYACTGHPPQRSQLRLIQRGTVVGVNQEVPVK